MVTRQVSASAPPPYLSYASFLKVLRGLSTNGIPKIIRGKDLQELSASLRAQALPALKFMELIDQDGRPSDRLYRLVDVLDTSSYPAELQNLLDDSYPNLKAIDLATCTPSVLARAFALTATSHEVARKASRFYLNAFQAAGGELGPRLQFGRRPRTTPTSNPSSDQRVYSPDATALHREMVRKLPHFDQSWPSDVKVAWLQSLGKLAESS